ncbi:MAG: HAD-IIIC family phosphatase [Planctomycetota bacterium]
MLNMPADEAWATLLATLRAAPDSGTLAAHNKAARAVAELAQAGAMPNGVRPLRIALLRSITAEVLENSLVACLAECAFAAQVTLGQLGNVAHEIWDDGSFVYAQPFDVCIVLALAEHILPGLFNLSQSGGPQSGVDAFQSQIEHLADQFQGLVIVCNFALPEFLLTPHLQTQTPLSGRYAVARANQRLAEAAAKRHNLVICDLESLVYRMGAERVYSARDMAAAMQPLATEAIPVFARQLAELCRLYTAPPVKCLVLDCDNTLWGGIVGEDGLSGIQLGETYPGLCYHQFQRQLDELNRLGFLLAINSRNNEADVKQVFERHSGMVLTLDQIAAARINWQDKATNMREIAAELNLGLDSFVFIDDSEFEINLIRDQLPEVRCCLVPRQPWALPGLLPQSGIIDRLSVTPEDREKAHMYAQERRRRQFQQEAGSLEQYLRGLGIRMKLEPFDPQQHLARAAQLTQKTNQFNLTTRRYTEAELLALCQQEASVFLASLSDRFGDHGRIALALTRPAASPRTCHLDVFLLSCRVIGRGVEDSFLRLVMREMRRAGFEKFTAEFIPTAKNTVCRDFLAKNNLVEVNRAADDRTSYEYDLTQDVPAAADWITIC